MTTNKNQNLDLEKKLTHIRRQEEEEKTKELASQWRLPYIDLTLKPVNTKALLLLEENRARQAEMAVIQKTRKSLTIAICNLNNKLTREILQEFENQGLIVNVFIASLSSLEKAWGGYEKIPEKTKRISDLITISEKNLKSFQGEIKTLDVFIDKLKTIKEVEKNISQILELILMAALQFEASDVHLEQEENYSLLRLRIDGILQNIDTLSSHIHNLLLSRVKLLSDLKLNVHDRAQGGRFSIVAAKKEIEVRASIAPSEYGEDIVLRVLDPKLLLSIKDLGLSEYAQKTIGKELTRPNGIILVTGPTGCGKTTTLYAFLQKIVSPKVKIITIEDPVEYHLKDIAQTQVNPEKGYDFPNALRSVLRQDPDIILVGEIRDDITTQIAFQAALTGHLVFSTLHTNDSVSAIPRLLNLGLDIESISAGLNVVIAQRLLRKVCKKCAKSYIPTPKILSKIQKIFQNLPRELKPKHKKIKLLKPVGCKYCNKTGYKGRVGVFEIFEVDEEMKKFILSRPSLSELKKKASQKGMIDLAQDAMLKVLEGITTIEEIERVIGNIDH